MIRIIDRVQAVQEIADHLADRTAYVATIPPTLLDAIGSRLHHIASWVAYIDNGTPLVLWTETGMDAVLAMAQALADAAGAAFTAVITMPKTVAPQQIRAAFGVHVPADGSRDILTVADAADHTLALPLLFIDALNVVDPATVQALIAANPTATLI